MSAFLRCMDYGILEILGKPKLLYKGIHYYWRKYIIGRKNRISSRNKVFFLEKSIIIEKDNYRISLDDFLKVQ